MQIATIVTNEDNVVKSVEAIVAENGIVASGYLAGRQLWGAAESRFYAACRRLDESLPEEIPDEGEEIPDNFPDFDSGYFEVGNMTVCLVWAEIVL